MKISANFRKQSFFVVILFSLAISIKSCKHRVKESTNELEATINSRADYLIRATELAQELLIVDTHIDLPYWLLENDVDVSDSINIGHFDYHRAKQGGLNVPFMSIYIPVDQQEVGQAKDLADSLIDMVEEVAEKSPDKFAIPFSTNDVEEHFSQGLISLPLGMENGAGIEDNLENLKHFYDRGIRYITLTHSESNLIGDASFSTDRPWNGLSPFGEGVIAEMNRLGIMVDISHVTDKTFFDVMDLTNAPVIASHSSCQHFTPGWDRNMSDELIIALAKNRGVIQINILLPFISNEHKNAIDSALTIAASQAESALGDQGLRLIDEIMENASLAEINVSNVADHIDHVVQLTSIDHVGLGTDFGSVNWLPVDFKDVSQYPNLIAELLRRGYSDEDISKICGGNLMRVWREVEEKAKKETR